MLVMAYPFFDEYCLSVMLFVSIAFLFFTISCGAEWKGNVSDPNQSIIL